MKTIFKKVIFTTLSAFLPLAGASAIDFDLDGYDDFVLINIDIKNRLEWYAIDVNDPARRPLGIFGRGGDHLAVGNWSADSRTSKALVKKRKEGDFEWNMQLPTGQRTIYFGKQPDTVISGFDADKNGAIDPVTVTLEKKKLIWRIMSNPALVNPASVQEVYFGSKGEIPFYANVDGNGDAIATAKVDKKGALILRYMNLTSGKIKSTTVGNFKSRVSKILPVSLPNGKDALFAVSKQGKKISLSIIKGKKKFKSLKVIGDEVVVGNYLGTAGEVLVIRKNAGKATFIDAAGKKSTISIDLDAVLADDVNINKFSNSNKSGGNNNSPAPSVPTAIPTEPPAPGVPQAYPVCAGVMNSMDHLLYKPISDTTGNVVLVFDSRYSREFLSVKIELKDGSFAEGWWKGLELWGNPDAFGPRQHWRTNVRSSQVKDNALIIVDDTSQECRFILPGSANKRWE